MSIEQREIDLRIRLHIASIRLAAAMVRLNSVHTLPQKSLIVKRYQTVTID
jgi:hypothetical protein